MFLGFGFFAAEDCRRYLNFFPIRGEEHSSNVGRCYPGTTKIGDYHTHGAESGPDYDDENFSGGDKDSNDSENGVGYLGVPSGAIKAYVPNGTPRGGQIIHIGNGAK